MALITLGELEAILGYDISSEDEVRVQSFIDLVSNFVESETGVHFGLHEDSIEVARSDGKGIIEIPDLLDVTLVERREETGWWELTVGSDYSFDGLDQIYGLCPRTVYRLTIDHGYEAVPADIKNVVQLLVLAGSGLDDTAVNGLKAKRVGDVEEQYGVAQSDTGEPQVTLSSMMRNVIDSYAGGIGTFRL